MGAIRMNKFLIVRGATVRDIEPIKEIIEDYGSVKVQNQVNIQTGEAWFCVKANDEMEPAIKKAREHTWLLSNAGDYDCEFVEIEFHTVGKIEVTKPVIHETAQSKKPQKL